MLRLISSMQIRFCNLMPTTSRFEQKTVKGLMNDLFCCKMPKRGIQKAPVFSPFPHSLKVGGNFHYGQYAETYAY